MKKILIFTVIFLLMGCSLNNNPTSKVEELFTKYNMLDEDIKKEVDVVVSSNDLTNEEQARYRKIIENQYKKLEYEIKDEKIDGDTAIITAEIEVIDYKKVIREVDKEYENQKNYSLTDYNNSKLTKLENAKEKVVYTLELSVIKDENGTWNLNPLGDKDVKKIQGMY